MGWGSGCEVAADVWDLVRDYVAPEHHKKVAEELCELFEAYDCDTLQDAEDLWDAAGRNESCG